MKLSGPGEDEPVCTVCLPDGVSENEISRDCVVSGFGHPTVTMQQEVMRGE